MADNGGKSRPRGRAKGRARPPPTQAAAPPGAEPRPVASTSSQPPMGSGGRQTHRGVSRTDNIRPGAQAAEVTEQMGALSVQPMRPAGYIGRGIAMEEVITRAPEKTKLGDSGEKIRLLTNYFKLQSRPTWCVHQYHVDFAPTVESSRMRRALLGDHRSVLGACYLFDGMSDLKSVVKLEQPVTELFSQRRSDGATIRITVKYTNELAPNNPQLGHLFNTQMRRNLQHLGFQLIGRHFFDRDAHVCKDQLNLEIWPGVVTSIRMQEMDLLMNVDTVHKIIRQDTAWHVLSNIVRQTSRGEYKEIAAKELVGAIVMTRYNTRTYRIEDICWNERPSDKFDSKEGPISYHDYYQKQYEISLNDPEQPLLLCTSKEREIRAGQSQSKRIMLVPELCLMTGLSERMRSNFNLMKELANETKLDPQQRANNLHTFMERLHRNDKVRDEMNAWQLSFDKNLVSLESRVLPEELIVQNTKFNYDRRSGDFSKEMRGQPMLSTVDLIKWLVICTKKDQSQCEEFLQCLDRVCRPMRFSVRRPEVIMIDDDRIGTYNRAFKEKYGNHLQMVLFIVPNNKKDRYDALKKLTCVDLPVPSQVVVSRTLSKRQMLMSVSTKIGIQLNCKLGGEPWAVEIPLKMRTMIIGYDTYHDSSRKGRSAGGFVASLNRTFTRWYSRVNFHQAGGWQELSNHLKVSLTEALKKYQEVNNAVPDMILFYRDGVGDGQVRYVLQWELAQMESCIAEVLEGHQSYDPSKTLNTRYAFLIVNKKISTRFFAAVGHGNRLTNPPPGTIVDHTVTRYERYDFFLVSQSVRQGTVAPTMYNIIKDLSGLKPDHMQRLSFKLTHLYYNWPGTIRVPAPCQYAHKLAFLAGQSLHREPHEALADKLFYL